MNSNTQQKLLKILQAESIDYLETLQELWSGYGYIKRLEVRRKTSEVRSIITKEIDLRPKENHPRGWNTDTSHQRKLRSYQIETAWYQGLAKQCGEDCKIPQLYHAEINEEVIFLAMEDLKEAGFVLHLDEPSLEEIKLGLDWLAAFHARFLNQAPTKLWKEGTYWHLATRPDEWKAMEEGPLKDHAEAIAKKLANSQFQTIVHGDAKLANFTYTSDRKQIAAVDFQYVGGGCGMKDVAYFLSSCYNTSEWQSREEELLNHYFESLQNFLFKLKIEVDFNALETEWRFLYPLAWADFIRFLKGWMPQHWKIDAHSEKMVEKGIALLARPKLNEGGIE